MLMSSIVSYFSAAHLWEPVIQLWEPIQQDDLMAETAIFGLIDIHLQRTRRSDPR